jgi:hypothetical protein
MSASSAASPTLSVRIFRSPKRGRRRCIHIAFTWHFKAYTYINVRAIRDEETEFDEVCDKRQDVAGNRFGTRGR